MTNLVEFPAGGSLSERVAEEVRALKGRHRVSQVQLAAHMHMSQVSVSERLRGKTPFTLADIDALAQFFNVSPAALLGYAASAPDGGGGGQVTDIRASRVTPTYPTLVEIAA